MPTLGPDATGVGWVYQYAVDGGRQRTLAELRATQDWQVRFAVAKAEGVAEVASVGGFVQQYQVVVDPRRLRAYGIPLERDARRSANATWTSAAMVVELAETEFMVRGRGYIRGIADIERSSSQGARRRPGACSRTSRASSSARRAARDRRAQRRGRGRRASSCMRFGENALTVIEQRQGELDEIRAACPRAPRSCPVYDRSELIDRAIDTLRRTLIEESLIVALVCIVFLLHVRSAFVAIITLPLGILIASSACMSLRAVVEHHEPRRHRDRHRRHGRRRDRHDRERAQAPGARAADKPRTEILIEAASEVGPALFFSLLIITVSFLPIFALEAQEGRLFKPLAYTKTFAMAAAALLSVTVVPALMVLFVRGRIVPEHRNPLNRAADRGLPAGHPRRAARQDADHRCSPSPCSRASVWPAMPSAASSCRTSTRAR